MTPTVKIKLFSLMLVLTFFVFGCKKSIQIPPPIGTITTSQVFSTDNQALSAVSGIYHKMMQSGLIITNGGMSIYSGLSADELIPYNQSLSDESQFYKNTLVSTNNVIGSQMWASTYSNLYGANAVMEGLQNYSGVHDSVRRELTGEAEFVRAFYNFYLINLFGSIPLVTTINWHKTNLLGRSPVDQVYQSIIADLKDASSLMGKDYSIGNGERIVPTKWAAMALLARVYLYLGDWEKAIQQADTIIENTSLFNLVSNPDSVFLANSTEAIWQLQQSNVGSTRNATPEGFALIPLVLDSIYPPYVYLSNTLLTSFEPNDKRRIKWVDSTTYYGSLYYFPYKYKVGPGQAISGAPDAEYYMVLRLAEIYLIRSEAFAQENDLANSSKDLNIIRKRAGLPPHVASSKSDLLATIAHENRIEFFSEWGHRWLDLKRTGQATSVLSPIKASWIPSAQLYPIPLGDILTDPNLTQNPGYQ